MQQRHGTVRTLDAPVYPVPNTRPLARGERGLLVNQGALTLLGLGCCVVIAGVSATALTLGVSEGPRLIPRLHVSLIALAAMSPLGIVMCLRRYLRIRRDVRDACVIEVEGPTTLERRSTGRYMRYTLLIRGYRIPVDSNYFHRLQRGGSFRVAFGPRSLILVQVERLEAD